MNFESVAGKVVIVTGAGSGIGKAIATVYAAHGMKVVCADLNESTGQSVVDSILSSGGDALFIKTNCSVASEIKALIEQTICFYGRLDGIVNNAGIGLGGFPLHEYELEQCNQIFDLNCKSVFAGMKYGAEAIFKSKSSHGFFINVASIAGLTPQQGQSLYTATKFGVIGMTKSAALDYAKYNITVNAICPGYTKTGIFGEAPEQAMAFFANDCPAGRIGEPEDVAYLALFLASDMARYITGAAIPIDGALSAGAKNLSHWKHPEIISDKI